jgi:hypothetical protein
VSTGMAEVTIGAAHRLANLGKVYVIEVQVSSYLGEDDIVWLYNVYRRYEASQRHCPSSTRFGSSRVFGHLEPRGQTHEFPDIGIS